MMRILNGIANIVGVILLLIIIGVLLLPDYARRAVNSGGPRIDDYTVFDQRVIENGNPQAWPVATNYNQFKLDAAIADTFEQLGTVAFVVIKDGALLHEEYWDGYGPRTVSNPFSVTKGIVGLAIGAAIDDGYIQSIDQPVVDFLPEFKTNGKQKITIKNLLTMSSGLNVTGSPKQMLFMAAEAYYGSDLRKMMNYLQVLDTAGVHFSYQNHNTEILAGIIEKVTGKHLATYVSDKFWKHMGAEQPASWSLDSKYGMEKAYCCFNTSARDIARWGQLMLNRGVWSGDTLVSARYLQQTVTPDTFLTDAEGKPVDFYGLHWWLLEAEGHKVEYLRGIAGQYLFVIPDLNMVVVRFGNKHHRERRGHHPADAYFFLHQAFQMTNKQ
jgi:CubicO group peptidase (beta-lactamase class C family)